MKRLEVSIKFCGGCNPKIDRGRVAEKVRELLGDCGTEVTYNKVEADFVVFLSGCTANCAERYNSTEAPFIIVAGASLDLMDVEESALAAEIINKWRTHYEGLGKDISK
jgi:hypothetical protein